MEIKNVKERKTGSTREKEGDVRGMYKNDTRERRTVDDERNE